MTTVVNNPGGGGDRDSGGAGLIIGIVIVLIILALFFIYVLPAIRGNAPGDTNNIDINLPERSDTNFPDITPGNGENSPQ